MINIRLEIHKTEKKENNKNMNETKSVSLRAQYILIKL